MEISATFVRGDTDITMKNKTCRIAPRQKTDYYLKDVQKQS